MKLLKNKKGFTLVELLVAMAIIGMLIALVYAAVGVARRSSRDTSRKSDMQTVQLQMEDYYGANNEYPETDEVTCEDPGEVQVGSVTLTLSQNLFDSNALITATANDPSREYCEETWCPDNISSNQKATREGWYLGYVVASSGGQNYCLVTRLENGECYAIAPEN